MLCVDLDGTLLDPSGRVAALDAAALRQAAEAGLMVVPCTGRAWREARDVLAGLSCAEVGVFVGGAAVSDIARGGSLDLAVIEPNLGLRVVRHLYELPEAVLIFRDCNVVGHDYLVTGRGTLSANTQWWFEQTGATVHFQRQVSQEDLHHTLRIGIVAPGSRVAEVSARIKRELGPAIFVQSFAAVQKSPAGEVHVLEVFAQGVSKWRGLSWVARQHGIEPGEVIAIGDEINDLAMVQAAGCGVAMGNAVAQVKAAARYTTCGNDRCGVGHAVEQVLSGRWGG
jgi:5-amino-6-(5-phospho-D-ribitylamino)uracil phosphatase